MSWDQQSYSFGNPNAQPPTPTRTPTSAQFPSPSFQTPKNSSSFESRAGWTPTFAEEYSVFNATPGRLIGSQNPFGEASTPRPATASTQNRRHSTIEGVDLVAELDSHVHHFSPNPTLQLPAVDPSNQLPSSPGPPPATQSQLDDSARKTVTPRRPKKRLDEAFSGQTATPPASSNGSRKLAPKFAIDTMQDGSQDNQYGLSQTPTGHSALMSFTATSGDFFSFPMSAPATAPVFSDAKSFWDPEVSMNGMDIDFTTNDTGMFNTSLHKPSTSFDWGRDNQIFQDALNTFQNPDLPAPQTEQPPSVKRQRQLAPKLPATSAALPTTLASFDLNQNPSANDSFPSSTLGSVNPGLLFSQNKSKAMTSGLEQAPMPASRPATSHPELKPYQHQLRERRRDQEELMRSRSVRESSASRHVDRGAASSPIRGPTRLGLRRSMSDSRGRRTQDRALARTGRTSPSKVQRSNTLRSIPELPPPRSRTEVKFTIDANGRARTETVLVREGSMTARRGPSVIDEDWGSSQCESSSDDEPILVPSRNTSFALSTQNNAPSLSRLDGFSRGHDYRSQHSHSESSSQRSFRQSSLGSEAETVMEDDDTSGDATSELRKVMQSRKRSQAKMQSHQYRPSSSRRSGSQYIYNSSTDLSLATLTDPDGATPSSTRSGTTRCVCNNPESEGYMIQCEGCDNWLHMGCVHIDRKRLPKVYICAFCAQTPNMRGGRLRESTVGNIASSPLAHKSFRSFR